MIRKINGVDLKLLSSGSDSSSTSQKVTPALLKTVLVPANTINPYDTIRIRTLFRKTTVVSSPFTIYLYWNTSNSLTGAIQVAIYNATGTTPSPMLYRTIKFRNNDTADFLSSSFSTTSDIGDMASGTTNAAIRYTVDGYYMSAAMCTGTGRIEDTILCSYLTIEL